MSTRLRLALVAASLALAACSTTTWEKPGAKIVDFEHDDAGCVAETKKNGPWANSWQEEAFHDRCLKERGWKHAS